MGGQMKAIGLWQPYAGLIRLGIKTIETRFWSTSYRGPLLICSTKRLDPSFDEVVANLRAAGHAVPCEATATTGAMECVVDVVDCRLGEVSDEEAACCGLTDVNPRTGELQQKHAIVLANVRPVVRRPVKCGRKWFDVDDALIELET